jgi:hypothetical protein
MGRKRLDNATALYNACKEGAGVHGDRPVVIS